MNNKSDENKTLSAPEAEALLSILRTRFEQNMHRHAGMDWVQVQTRVDTHPEKLPCLQAMESTGGEPDVIGMDEETGEILIYDCSAESPAGRRSLCYDAAALEGRKANKPEHNAMDLAAEMGIRLLSEAEYYKLQALGAFDLKTSSWLMTPPEVRQLGGAIFGDRRYGRVFVYHNGAESYYGARGFRGVLRV